MNYSQVIFIDPQDLLFDNDQLKKIIKSALISVLGQSLGRKFWILNGEFNRIPSLEKFPKKIVNYCKQNHPEESHTILHRIYNQIDFSSSLIPEAITILDSLSTFSQVCLFTEGDSTYHHTKLTQSGLAQHTDKVYFFKNKLDHLLQLQHTHFHQQLVFIDPNILALENISRILQKSTTILIHPDITLIPGQFKPNFMYKNLTELIANIQNTQSV